MEVLVVGNTAYVDDDFCAKAFPGDHVQVVAAQDTRRDESSPYASWKELLQHLDQAYEFDRVVYLSNSLPRMSIAWAISSCCVRSFARAWVAGSSCCI